MSDSTGDSAASLGNVRFEEGLSLDDEAGARRLIGFSRVLVVSMTVFTIVIGYVVARSAVGMVGGVDVVLSVVNDIRAERPPVFAGLVLGGVLVVGYVVLSLLGLVFQMRRAFDTEIYASVTDTELRVTREGSGFWQSSGVVVPFDAIASVEYLHPDESSTRIEVGDVRSKQFFAGRSTDWVPIGRRDDPTVYVGSDRSMELAELIARSAPNVENAEPY